MREVDLVVHAPVYEGFGLVVAEAMAAGRPVVGNDAAGGVKEMIVDGETGLIAPAGSPAALARALASLVDDPPELQRMGQRGRNASRHSSPRRDVRASGDDLSAAAPQSLA